jgi:hypothetical protein
MSEFGNLRSKKFARCSMRLDNTKRSDVRCVNDVDFLNTLNVVKPIILTNKRKEPDPNKINIGDLVCGRCRGYAKKFKPDTVQLLSSSDTIFDSDNATIDNDDDDNNSEHVTVYPDISTMSSTTD